MRWSGWRDYDPTMKPLGRLDVHKSFSPRLSRTKVTKTGKQRLVPAHPTLARILAEWKLSGWAAMFGRAPTPDDLIVPDAPCYFHNNGHPLSPDACAAELARVRDLPPADFDSYRKSRMTLKRFHADCLAIGMRPRRVHDKMAKLKIERREGKVLELHAPAESQDLVTHSVTRSGAAGNDSGFSAPTTGLESRRRVGRK